jgi:hypothetical protein
LSAEVSLVVVVVSVVVVVLPEVVLLCMLPEELLDMFAVLPVVSVDELPTFAGVFMSLFVLLVMLPVPVPPVFEPAFGGVPLMSVLLVVVFCGAEDDAMLLAVVSLLLLPLIRSRSERQPNVVMTSANRTVRASFVLLRVI